MKESFLSLRPAERTLAEMYTLPYIYGNTPTGLEWAPAGTRLGFLWNAEGGLCNDIYVVTDGEEPEKLTDAEKVPPLPVEDDERPEEEVAYANGMYGGITQFAWGTDGTWLAFLCRGDLFTITSDGKTLKRLTTSAQGKSSMQISRDGRYIMFLMSSNVWSYDRESGALAQLTYFSKKDVAVQAYSISPDSRWVAIEVSDQSMYETVRMPDYSPLKGVKIKELRRNNVGKPLSKERIGILPIGGGRMKRVKIEEPGTPEEKKAGKEGDTGNNIRIYGILWLEDSSNLIVAYSCARYQEWHLCKVVPGQEEAPEELIKDTIKPWYEHTPLAGSPDSAWVYFPSFRNSWRHIYRISKAGGELEQVTSGEYDIMQYTIPRAGNTIFYSALTPDPQKTVVYAIPLEGGTPEKIDTKQECTNVTASNDGTKLALLASSVLVPEIVYIKNGNEEPVKVLTTARPEWETVTKAKVTQFTFSNESDGVTVHAKMLLPAGFDQSKKYPVVFSCVYAGQGKMGFGRYQVLDNFMVNEMGYIIVGVDLRASLGYGKEFFYGYHKKLGIIDSEELVSCANYLKTLPYIDSERMGIWGGSYGGFLTLMAMCNYPGVFHTGISWKPVTDWRNYWDSYTCPRLTRPEDDSETYTATSPVFHAEGLRDNLLIVHGMQDDNVLFQDAAWMIQKLIEAGKYFDLMIYPRDDHGLTLRHESLPDCMERFAAYFEKNMGLGPR